MATLEECQVAIQRLSAMITRLDPAARRDAIAERTVSAAITDLGVTFAGRLDAEGFHDMSTEPAPQAQIRLTTTSDDLVGLADGSLAFGRAWSQGRLKVQASFGDLLRLRKLL